MATAADPASPCTKPIVTGRAVLSDTRRSSRASVSRPSTISITATAISSERPTRGGICVSWSLSATIAPPARRIVVVWPIPHSIPVRAARASERCCVTIVVTATT